MNQNIYNYVHFGWQGFRTCQPGAQKHCPLGKTAFSVTIHLPWSWIWEYENMDAPFMEVLWQMSMCFLYLGPVAVHVVLAVCWILASLPHPRIFLLMRPRCSIITRQTFPWDSCRLLQGQEEIQALWIQVHSLPLHLSPPRQSKTWADMLKFNSDDKTLTPPAPLLWKKEFQPYLNL